MLSQCSRQALSGNRDIIKILDELLEKIPDQAKAGKQGTLFVRYLEFLKELTLAQDKKIFLVNADPGMADLLRQLLEEQTGSNKPRQNSIVQVIEQLTRQAMIGEPGIDAAIDKLLEQLPNKSEGDDQDHFIRNYLEFLKELARATDKKAFLATADEEILGVMQQLSQGKDGE